MRTTIKIRTTATTSHDALAKLSVAWRQLMDDDEVVLPTDSELLMEKTEDESTYSVSFTARTKLEWASESSD